MINPQNSIKNYSVRNSKDAAFAFVFSDAYTLAHLYRGMTGKEIPIEDIEPLNLDKMFETKKRGGNTPYEAFTFAVSECLAKGYLSEILSRKESFDMFAEKYCYDDHLREAGREEGREEGRVEGLLEAAVRLLRAGMGLQEVSSVLGLTDAQLKALETIPA